MENSLNALLQNLPDMDNSVEKEKWCKRFAAYYEKNSRHSYSEVTEYILNNIGGIDYSYDIVAKLEKLYTEKLLDENLQKKLLKLIDHIKLEQVRYKHLSDAIEESVKQHFLKLSNEKDDAFTSLLNDANEKLKETEKELKNYYNQQTEEIDSKVKALRQGVDVLSELSIEAEDKIKNAQTENTAILGIFASIVLTFTGGMMFSSSIMENLNNSSFYRLFLICLVLGGILLNLISALLIYVNRIINYKHKSKSFIKENAFWIVVNSLLVVGIILTLILWEFSDEKKVNDSHNAYTIKMYENSLETVSENNIEFEVETQSK